MAGDHVLTEVEIASVYADSPTDQGQVHGVSAPNAPQITDVHVGTRLCRCTWSPDAHVGEETTTVIESLC